MEKRKIIVFSIISVIVFIVSLVFENNEITFIENGVTYALTVDGQNQNSFPSKGMYRVDTECENATCRWDYDAWKLYIEDITGNVTCKITFTTIGKTYFNDYIASLLNAKYMYGYVVEENGYRYEGSNPKNYVWFNNELWRIIGVMDSETHGQTGLNLVKIIRKYPIENSSFGSNWKGWKNSKLKLYLNEYYLNSDINNTSGECVNPEMVSTITKCDYRYIGINKNYKKFIKNVNWYLGSIPNASQTANDCYLLERKDAEGNISEFESGFIGLMYASDYGYSVLDIDCPRNTTLNKYNGNCAGLNWLYYDIKEEWMLTNQNSNGNKYMTYKYISGSINYTNDKSKSVRPTLYLNENVYVLDGDGSITDPYIIAMDEA